MATIFHEWPARCSKANLQHCCTGHGSGVESARPEAPLFIRPERAWSSAFERLLCARAVVNGGRAPYQRFDSQHDGRDAREAARVVGGRDSEVG